MFKIGLIDDLLDDQDMPAGRKADLMRRRRHLYDEVYRQMDIERTMLMADQIVSERNKLDDIGRRTKRILRDRWLFDIVHYRLPYIAYAFTVMAAVAVALRG